MRGGEKRDERGLDYGAQRDREKDGGLVLFLTDGLVSNEAASILPALISSKAQSEGRERERERYGGKEEALIWGEAVKRQRI